MWRLRTNACHIQLHLSRLTREVELYVAGVVARMNERGGTDDKGGVKWGMFPLLPLSYVVGVN
jgi:hypothetical protein